MKLSCKEIPVRMWIILLIFTTRFLMISLTQIMGFCWKHMTETSGQVRYKPWCFLTTQQRMEAALIPWYNESTPNYGPRYKWTTEHLSYSKDALFYGQMLSSLPGGIIAEYAGSLYVLLYASSMAAILNAGRVIISAVHWEKLVVLEFFIGIHIGLVYPAVYIWIARWAPPNERGVFMASQVGNGFGHSLSRIFVRYMVAVVGWQWIFYIYTLFAILNMIPLWFLGSNNPEDHKRISAKELLYIKRSQRGKVTPTRSFPPFGNILSSGAFWSLNILSFGVNCTHVFYRSVVDTFLFDFMGIPKKVVEVIEVFPYLAHCAVAIMAALFGDYVRTKKVMDDSIMIKANIVFSHLGPGCVLLFMGVAYCNQNVAIALLFVGYAASGCSIVSTHRTIIDISPNYAGTVYGLLHISRSIVNIVVPRLRRHILMFNSGIIGWTIIFLIGGGCMVGTGVIFLFFGTANTQWWNLKSQDIYKLYHYKKPEERRSPEGESNFAGTSRTQNEPQETDLSNKEIDIDTEDWKLVKDKTSSVNVDDPSQPTTISSRESEFNRINDSDSVWGKSEDISQTTWANHPETEHEKNIRKPDTRFSRSNTLPIASRNILSSKSKHIETSERITTKSKITILHGTHTDLRLEKYQEMYGTKKRDLSYFNHLLQNRSKSFPDIRCMNSFETDIGKKYDDTKVLQ